jgi:hypothetical protein
LQYNQKACAIHSDECARQEGLVIPRSSILWFLLAASCLGAQNAILLNHANVIDGFSDEPIRDTAVLVEDGRIAALAPTFGKLPPDTVTIDLSGRWLLPGLIDAHVHLNDLRAARDLVHTGVTTIRTMGVRHHIDIGIRELHRGGDKELPDVVASGYALVPNMFSSEEFLLDFPQLAALVRSKVTGTENVRQLVRANLQHGVNVIKILATERAGIPDTDPRGRLLRRRKWSLSWTKRGGLVSPWRHMRTEMRGQLRQSAPVLAR